MVILKSSEIRKDTVKSADPDKRNKYLDDKVIPFSNEINGKYILSKDITVTSPSTAAWLVSGTGLNGWNFWKDSGGKTLDEVYRKCDNQ